MLGLWCLTPWAQPLTSKRAATEKNARPQGAKCCEEPRRSGREPREADVMQREPLGVLQQIRGELRLVTVRHELQECQERAC